MTRKMKIGKPNLNARKKRKNPINFERSFSFLRSLDVIKPGKYPWVHHCMHLYLCFWLYMSAYRGTKVELPELYYEITIR